ncbi:MAG: ATP-binding protein [Rhodobacterales bacterium]
MATHGKINDTVVDLQTFERKNSRNGKFLRYAHGRAKAFLSRQILTVTGSVLAGFFISPFAGMLCALATISGEAIDCLYLRSLRHETDQTVTPSQITRSATTGAIQAISIAISVAITWVWGDPSIRFFALAFLSGASLNAGIVWRFNPPAIAIRMIIYILTACALFLYDAVRYGITSPALIQDLFAALILAYTMAVFIVFMRKNQSSHENSERAMLEQRHETSVIAENLRLKMREIRQLAEVVESSNDVIIFRNPKGEITWVNKAFTKTFGFGAHEARGKLPRDLIISENTDLKSLHKLRHAFEKKLPIRINILYRPKCGPDVWMDNIITPLFDRNNTVYSFVSVSRDITRSQKQMTELKKAREEAEQAAMAKSTFLATMSHEIRTPMNGIIGMSDLLRQTELATEQREYVDTIVNSGEALLQIINDILDFSKLESGKLQITKAPMNIHKNLHSVVSILGPTAIAKGIDLSLHIADEVPEYVSGDDGRIRQIIINLIGNAIKFTPKGSVAVSVTSRSENKLYQVKVAIRDTGIGIPADKLDHIFERFSQAEADTTRRFGGTGLGLSISHLLARQMDGDIKVSSKPGAGSCFTLELPLHAAKNADIPPQNTPAEHPAIDLHHTHILVAEDNRTNQLLLRKMLGKQVGKLEFAQNGEQVVEMFIKTPPDIVLMDVSMPKKNGLDATRDIRIWEKHQSRHEIPIIALTANAFPEDRKKCLNSGMTGFLEKPIKKQHLLESLGQSLG